MKRINESSAMPDPATLIPNSATLIPNSAAVIPDSGTVIPDLIRDPVPRKPWIADVETPDLIRGRNDKLGARNDKK